MRHLSNFPTNRGLPQLSRFQPPVVARRYTNRRIVESIRGHYDFDIRYFVTGLPREVYGNSVARNIGLMKARSDIIICTDDDCLVHTHFVEAHVKSHKDADGIMVSGVRVVDKAKLSQPLPVEVDDKKSLRYIEKFKNGEFGAGGFLGANVSTKKKHLEMVGGWNERLTNAWEYGYTDRELGMRLMGLGLKAIVNTDAVMYHRPIETEIVEFRDRHNSAERAHSRFKRIQRVFKIKRIVAALLRCIPFIGKNIALEFLRPKRIYTNECPQQD